LRGRLGVSDRYRDLAIGCNTAKFNLGEDWVNAFLHRSGVTRPD
jgi:aminoglycoside 3'-phosphotransferase-2